MIRLFISLLIWITCGFPQEIIDFQEKGKDNGIRSTRDQDYEEALVDAKRKILEKAGIEVKSYSKVEDFQLVKDLIESKSEGVILPGMNIADFGYDENGYYQVFLVGKIKIVGETILDKKIRYAKSLYERDLKEDAKYELDNIINSSKDDDLIAQAIFFKIKWRLSKDITEEFERLKAYYPNTKYIQLAEQELIDLKISKQHVPLRVIYHITNNKKLVDKGFIKTKIKGVEIVNIFCSNCGHSSNQPYKYNLKDLKPDFFDNFEQSNWDKKFNPEPRVYFLNKYLIEILIHYYGEELDTNTLKENKKTLEISTDQYESNVQFYCFYLEINGKGKIIYHTAFPYIDNKSLAQIIKK